MKTRDIIIPLTVVADKPKKQSIARVIKIETDIKHTAVFLGFVLNLSAE